jgi:hypothetical protein
VGVLPSGASACFLVRGDYSFTSNVILQGGAYRQQYANWGRKILRGYTIENGYFGTGRFSVTLTGAYLGINACDLFTLQNANIYGSGVCAVKFETGFSYSPYFVDVSVIGSFSWYAISCGYGVNAILRRLYVNNNNESALSTSLCILDMCFIQTPSRAIWASVGSGTVVIKDSIVNAGGGIWYEAGSLLISDSVFSCRSGTGTAIDIGDGSAGYCCHVSNSILRNFSQDVLAEYGSAFMTNCCTTSASSMPFWTDGCFQADPQFVDAANGDFRLKPTSPCWGMGLANPWISGNVADIGVQGVRPPFHLLTRPAMMRRMCASPADFGG